MSYSRFIGLFSVCIMSACASNPASLNNTSTATDVQSAGTLQAAAETPNSTEVSIDGAGNSMRGPAPRRGLLGEWLIEDVDRRGVMDNVQLTLTFDDKGRVSGQLGCNAVTGRFTADKGKLSFGPLVSTRKMCVSPAVMNQEDLVLRSLQMLNTVSWSDNGAAILGGPEGHSIVMRKIAPLSASGMAHGDISPTLGIYRCANEAVGIAFEAGAAYLTEADGVLIVLKKIDGAGDNAPETFTNGRVTVFRKAGSGVHVSFARGRMAPVECKSTTG